MFPPQPVPIAEVGAGLMVTVRGTVVPRDLMDAPLTHDRCVYYRYVIEQWRQSRVAGVGGDGFWEVVEQDEAILEFYIEDGSGRAIVAPRLARIEWGRRIPGQRVDVVYNRRARQFLIEPGDTVEVTARASLATDLYDEGRGYRSWPGRILLAAPPGGQLAVRLVSKATATTDISG